MPITAHQRQVRQKSIGSSDVPALFGKSPWASAYDVWLEKTGRVDPKPPTDWQTAGSYLEMAILQWASKEHLGPIRSNQRRSRPDLHMAANIDAVVIKTGEPVEAKAAGAFGSWSKEFGEPGTDALPDYVILQAHVHLICLEGKGPVNPENLSVEGREAKWRGGSSPQVCWVPHCRGGYSLRMYQVPRNETIVTAIKQTCVKFWEENVMADVPPEGCVASAETLKMVRRTPDSVGVVDPALVRWWLLAKENAAKHKDTAEKCQRQVIQAMEQNEGAVVDGFGDLTYYSQDSKRVDTDKLKAAGIYEEYAKTSSHRVLRFKETKETNQNG